LCFADVVGRLARKMVMWEEKAQCASSAGHAMQFSGVPFMIAGYQIRECASGKPQKRRSREQAVSAVLFTDVCFSCGHHVRQLTLLLHVDC